jgi:hypothetical protein
VWPRIINLVTGQVCVESPTARSGVSTLLRVRISLRTLPAFNCNYCQILVDELYAEINAVDEDILVTHIAVTHVRQSVVD